MIRILAQIGAFIDRAIERIPFCVNSRQRCFSVSDAGSMGRAIAQVRNMRHSLLAFQFLMMWCHATDPEPSR